MHYRLHCLLPAELPPQMGPLPFGDIVGLAIVGAALIYDACKPKDCDPPEGTICSQYHETGQAHGAIDGEGNKVGKVIPHVHTWVQEKWSNVKCQWKKQKAAQLTFSNFTPINARACSSYESWNNQEGKK